LYLYIYLFVYLFAFYCTFYFFCITNCLLCILYSVFLLYPRPILLIFYMYMSRILLIQLLSCHNEINACPSFTHPICSRWHSLKDPGAHPGGGVIPHSRVQPTGRLTLCTRRRIRRRMQDTTDAKLYMLFTVVVNGHNFVAVRRRTGTDGNRNATSSICRTATQCV